MAYTISDIGSSDAESGYISSGTDDGSSETCEEHNKLIYQCKKCKTRYTEGDWEFQGELKLSNYKEEDIWDMDDYCFHLLC